MLILAYAFDLGKLSLIPFGRIQNILNIDYFDNLRVNAFGNRFFEPGLPRNYTLGIRCSF